MGNRKKKGKKSKAKPRIRITPVVGPEIRSNSTGLVAASSLEILLKRRDSHLTDEDRIRKLHDYYAALPNKRYLASIIHLLPKELIVGKHPVSKRNLLFIILDSQNPSMELVSEVLKKMTKEDVRERFYDVDGIEQDVLMKAYALCRNTEVIVAILHKSGYLDEVNEDSDIVAMAKTTASYMGNFKRGSIFGNAADLHPLLQKINNEDFTTAMNIHEIRLYEFDVQPRHVSDELLEKKVRINNDSEIPYVDPGMHTALYLKAFIEERQPQWDYDTTQAYIMHTTIQSVAAVKYIETNKFAKAEQMVWEMTQNKTDTAFEMIWDASYNLLDIAMNTFPRLSQPPDIANVKSILLMMVNYLDNPQNPKFAKEYIAKQDRGNDHINTTYLFLGKSCEYAEKYEEGLDYFCHVQKGSDVYYLSIMWQAMMYFHIKKDHPKIAETLRLIKHPDATYVLRTHDYMHFMCLLYERIASCLNTQKFDEAAEKMNVMRSIDPQRFLAMFEAHTPRYGLAIEKMLPSKVKNEDLENSSYYEVITVFRDTFGQSGQGWRQACELTEGIRYGISRLNIEETNSKHYFFELFNLIKNYIYIGKPKRALEWLKSEQIDYSFVNSPLLTIRAFDTALVAFVESEFDIAEYIMSQVPMKYEYRGRGECTYEFDNITQICHELMKRKRFDLTIHLSNLTFVYYAGHANLLLFHLIKAKAYRLQRNLEMSIQSCEECLKMDPECPNAHFELGMSQMLSKMNSEAIESFDTCLKFDPSNKNAKAALKKMKRIK